ncbi:transporter substrate-binding domain-containing protein [Pendulispora albinea]|uniref:Transporter substrate-binding domain-containing protein n=1 Tax=Pendulispora albinea TaxID=2741071 RepID=A0ABZ2LTI0_9BACT
MGVGRTSRFVRYLVVLCQALAVLCFVASPEQARAADPPLKVYVKPIEPFMFQEGGKSVGFSVDLWDRVAKETGITYELQWVRSVGDQIDALKNKQADAAIAAISITAEREAVVDFSQPFYESGLGILVGTTHQSSVRSLVKSVFTLDFLKLIGALVVLLVVTAHLLWFFERNRNPDQFPRPYLAGVWESAWWAISTILSGGCDAKGPIVIGGRIVGAFWMLASIVLVSYFTASITTVMTVNQLTSDINGPGDLPGQIVGTVKGTTGEKYLTAHRVSVRAFDRIEEAYFALEKKQIKAVVYDAPVLLYHVKQSKSDQLKVVGRLFEKQNYGIALQQGSKYRKPINEALLKLRESGYMDELSTKWFGPSE